MDWYDIQTALAEVLLAVAVILPIALFFYGWAMALTDSMAPEE